MRTGSEECLLLKLPKWLSPGRINSSYLPVIKSQGIGLFPRAVTKSLVMALVWLYVSHSTQEPVPKAARCPCASQTPLPTALSRLLQWDLHSALRTPSPVVLWERQVHSLGSGGYKLCLWSLCLRLLKWCFPIQKAARWLPLYPLAC